MKTKLGIYGGSYAPVHNGHIGAALEFKRQFALDKLLIIPARIPPHKDLPRGDTPLHRLNMLNIAFETYEGIEVSTYELDKEGTSYSVETLSHFSAEDRELYFLCGTDMFLCMHTWYRVEEIAKLATLVYTRRENDPELDSEVEKQKGMLREKYGFRIEELKMKPLELSSTLIRSSADPSPYLPEAVAQYIKDNKLYVQ
ncbi:MAG: nicotinate (nicotinamide) nucleotide adenylyltransferase [Clostridia bacterium]|nr:nicotinate (nicotinamide) nucleotide adenylyltransferase [Clostridia bacterium]